MTTYQRLLAASHGGSLDFYTPIQCDETILFVIPPHTTSPLYVHKYQTNQIFVVQGEFVQVVVEKGRYNYYPISNNPQRVLTILPQTPHFAINTSDQPCIAINAALFERDAMGNVMRHPLDYRPQNPPMQPNFRLARKLQERWAA